ncbi:hypothetical protein N7467_008225 [Penicillium canescens]|nr:hypothetical protein N7467_008225 [Penicillium canescens]
MPVSSLNLNQSAVSAPWQILTVCFAALLLLGYMILAVAINNTQDTLRIDITGSITCAFVFVGVSYISSALVVFCQRHQKLFLIHYVFCPYSIINLLALFNALFHVLARDLPLNTLRVMSIGLPAAFFAIYPLAALFVYHDNSSSRPHPEDGTPLLSDEEMQRRQMLRLLQDQSSAPSPDLIRNTYRFDLPQHDAAPRY